MRSEVTMKKDDTVRIPVEVIQSFMVDVFKAQGVSDEDARICAEVLITSDLRGIESHGVGRLKYYFDRIQMGVQFPTAKMEIVKDEGATALVDGFVVGDIQNDKTIHLATSLTGFAPGDQYHLYANDEPPTFAPGKYHGAVWLDGVDDYVLFGGQGPSLSEIAGNELTIAAWINPADPDRHQRIITKNGPFTLGLSGRMLEGSIYAGGVWSRLSGHIPIEADQWQHVALIYDGSHVSLYVNGWLDSTRNQSGDLEGSGCVQVGRANNGGCYGDPGLYFEGGIDDLFIFRRALSQSELRAMARAHVHEVFRHITGLAAGTYRILAYAKDIDGNLVQTEERTIHVQP